MPGKKQSVEEGDTHYYLSLRNVLRNRKAKDYMLSQWKKAEEAVASALGIYQSDPLIRDLRANKYLVEMMDKCDKPFSLLGKFEAFGDYNYYTLNKPILIIPDAVDTHLINDWENANALLRKTINTFLIPITKKVSFQEYSFF